MIAIMALLPPGPFVQGQGVDETIVDEWVEARYDVVFPSFDEIRTDVSFQVYEADLDQTVGVPASTLRQLMSTNDTISETIMDDLGGDLEGVVTSSLSSLELEGSTITITGPELEDIGEDDGDDIYKGPLLFEGAAVISLDPASIGLPMESDMDALVSGTLKMGGVLNLSFELVAEAGHMNTFRFTPPSGNVFMAGQAMTSVQEFVVDGRASTGRVTKIEHLVFTSSSPADLEEAVAADGLVDIQEFDDLSITMDIVIDAVDSTEISPYFPDVIGLDLVSADGIRMAVENGLMTWDDVYGLAVREQVKETEGQLSALMVGSPRLTFQWNGSSLSGYDPSKMTGPSLKGRLTGNGSIDLRGLSVNTAMEALRSGAKVPLELDIDSDLDWKVDLCMPLGTTLEGTGLTPTKGQDGRVRFHLNKGYPSLKGFVVAEEENDHAYHGKISLDIRVKEFDDSIRRVLGQRRTTIWFDIDIEVDVNSVPLEGALSEQVPKDIEMERADADFVRALLADGEINRSIIDDVVEGLRPIVVNKLTKALGGEAVVRLFVEEQSLDVNTSGPVRILGSATAEKEKDIDSLATVEHVIEVGQRFQLEGEEGWKVEYTISLPEGTKVVNVKHSRSMTEFEERPELSNDRVLTEVITDGGSDNVTLYVKPTVGYSARTVLSQPICSVPFFLFLACMIGLTYWFFRRRKLANKGHKGKKERSIDDYKTVPARVKGHGRPVRTHGKVVDRAHRTRAHRPKGPVVAKKVEQGPPRKKVKCPDCGRRFSVDPRYSDIVCPHCGRKGKITVARAYKKVQCPRCKHVIRYRKGDTTIRCENCGKVGKVKG
jgi:DNA-directed RNA polymerase subunit RPC12/RpoP